MELEIKIKSENAAMVGDAAAPATAALLRQIAARIEAGEEDGYCFDDNGNRVGDWYFDASEGED